MTSSPMLSLPEVAQRLGITYRSAYDLVLTNRVRAQRIGRSFRISETELMRFKRERQADDPEHAEALKARLQNKVHGSAGSSDVSSEERHEH